MTKTKIAGIGMYIPEHVVTNNELAKYMDTTDEWIQERTGIVERRFAHRTKETTATMGVEAAKIAIERAGTTAQDIDFIIFATISPGLLFSRLRCIGATDHENEGNWCAGCPQPMQRFSLCSECG